MINHTANYMFIDNQCLTKKMQKKLLGYLVGSDKSSNFAAVFAVSTSECNKMPRRR